MPSAASSSAAATELPPSAASKSMPKPPIEPLHVPSNPDGTAAPKPVFVAAADLNPPLALDSSTVATPPPATYADAHTASRTGASKDPKRNLIPKPKRNLVPRSGEDEDFEDDDTVEEGLDVYGLLCDRQWAQLRRRKKSLTLVAGCSRCGSLGESTTHALCTCSKLLGVWNCDIVDNNTKRRTLKNATNATIREEKNEGTPGTGKGHRGDESSSHGDDSTALN